MADPAGIDVDLEALTEICRRWEVGELSVFGSVARGEAEPDSGIDLLYVFEPDATGGWDIVELEEELAGVFGRKVDLVSKHYLHRFVRDRVLAEAQIVYVSTHPNM